MSAVTCACGRICKSRSGFATHARVCAEEQTRSEAFLAATRSGDWTEYIRRYRGHHSAK